MGRQLDRSRGPSGAPLPGAEAYILQKYRDYRIVSKYTLWNCIPKY